jgi:CAAX prenyl protease-like protein
MPPDDRVRHIQISGAIFMENQAGVQQHITKEEKTAIWAHTAPFVAWVVLMEVLGGSAIAYAARVAICLGLLLWFRPWRWYRRMKIRGLPLAVALGVLVFVIWVLPESAWMGRWPALQNAYLKIGILPPWTVPEPLEAFPYAPEVCGWPLTLVRLLGSTLVVALVEEYFWRGFLYRWLVGREFLKVDLGTIQISMMLVVSLLFGLEHRRWLVGVIAGIIYLVLAVKRRDIGLAIVAHATTNLLLSFYVLVTGSYAFW